MDLLHTQIEPGVDPVWRVVSVPVSDFQLDRKAFVCVCTVQDSVYGTYLLAGVTLKQP